MARVVVVSSYAKSLVGFRALFLQALVERGHEVYACAPDAPHPVPERLDEMRVSFLQYPLARTGLNPAQDIVSVVALRRIFLELSPDIFFGYTIKPAIYGSWAAHLAKVPLKAAMITGLGHAFTAASTSGRVLRKLVCLLYRQALRHNEVVVFQNPDDRKRFEQLRLVAGETRRVVVNGSGVDLGLFSPQPMPRTLNYMFISRLLVEKGVREFIQAARLVRARHPQVKFHLVGWIDESPNSISERELQAWIAEGLVQYHGYVDDVVPTLAQSSVFVLPSYYPEGTPRTILEALAAGRPVITTDTPGCRETVRRGVNGYLVPPRDALSLHQAMLQFVNNPDLIPRMGAASRRLAEEKFDVHDVNAALLRALRLDFVGSLTRRAA